MKKCLLKFPWVKVPREEIPALKGLLVRLLRVSSPNFYLARELKQVNDYELNKIRFTRLVGAIAYPGGAYAVYNNRDQMLNWMGEGERKIRNHLQSIFTPMSNFSFPLREAILSREGNFCVYCFHEQVDFLRRYLGDRIRLATVSIESVERVFKIEEKCLL